MKAKLFLICTAALLINVGGSAQEIDLSRIPVQTATIVSNIKQQSYEKSVFNFEYGVRGDAEFPEHRLVRYDIRYGGMSDGGDDRWLEIVYGRGVQSMIKDMGEMSWPEIYHVPILFASPDSHTGMLAYSYKDGELATISPEGVVVKAVVGHMYVMHVKDHAKEYYVMLRVEAIDAKGECKFSWKNVPSPEK
jgi:hypothetical protein